MTSEKRFGRPSIVWNPALDVDVEEGNVRKKKWQNPMAKYEKQLEVEDRAESRGRVEEDHPSEEIAEQLPDGTQVMNPFALLALQLHQQQQQRVQQAKMPPPPLLPPFAPPHLPFKPGPFPPLPFPFPFPPMFFPTPANPPNGTLPPPFGPMATAAAAAFFAVRRQLMAHRGPMPGNSRQMMATDAHAHVNSLAVEDQNELLQRQGASAHMDGPELAFWKESNESGTGGRSEDARKNANGTKKGSKKRKKPSEGVKKPSEGGDEEVGPSSIKKDRPNPIVELVLKQNPTSVGSINFNTCAICGISFRLTSELVQHARSNHRQSSRYDRQQRQSIGDVHSSGKVVEKQGQREGETGETVERTGQI